MKILHLSSFDEEGGAARAAMRLHKGLKAIDHDSWMAVRKKTGNDDTALICGGDGDLNKLFTKLRPHIDSLPLKLYPNKTHSPWSVAWLPNRLDRLLSELSPSIIHSHWIANGYLSVSNLKSIKSKFIWTLHDSWPFTGGCHITQQCVSFREKCGNCPQLASSSKRDLSSIGYNAKQKLYMENSPIFVAPSSWMAKQAKSSSLLACADIRVIPNGLDTNIFYPRDKNYARKTLNLPTHKKLIMFGAMSATADPNKGFKKLVTTLNILNEFKSDAEIELVVFGSEEPSNPPEFGFKATYLGRIRDDETLALAYSAADVMCVPSIQESFGQVATEAMSCGLPVVAYATSGLMDIVQHGITGYLASPYDEFDFAKGIKFLLDDETRYKTISNESRKKVLACFDISDIGRKHLELYKEVLEMQRSK